MSVESHFHTFVAAAREVLATPGAMPESSLYGAFSSLLGCVARDLAPSSETKFVPQAGAEDIGIPDYRVSQRGELLGWVELKATTKPLDRLTGHDARQRERFVDGLHNLILTNGWEWQLYQDGRQIGSTVRVATAASFQQGALPASPTDDEMRALEDLLRSFLTARLSNHQTVSSAVTALAVRARSLRNGLTELGEAAAGANLISLKADFKNLVFRNGQTFDWTRFVDSYVQIAAFGALLWRLQTRKPISLEQQIGLKHGVHPLLYQCLQILWSPSSRPPLIQPLLEELCRTINLIPPELFDAPAVAADRRYVPDPIVHAYEPFFAVYDSEARDAAGVYYTPVQVVEHIVSGVEHILTTTFERPLGLLDPDARYLDPATGTGTFLLGLAQATARAAAEKGLPTDAAVHELVTNQLSAFELMPGPYTIAHQRMESLLETFGAPTESRLPIYLTDTLAAPEGDPLATSGFGIAGDEILRERQQADRVKAADELLVVLGNPPYERLSADTGIEQFARGLMDILKDNTPAENRSNLKSTSDLYVAFWMWALWALQPPAIRTENSQTPEVDTRNANGIVAYISNRTWLQGASLIGLRSIATRGARDIWVMDLGGDNRGAEGIKDFAGGDVNVFDIQTGVAIVWVVFDRSYEGEPTVHYRRILGKRADKYAALREPFDPDAYETVSTAPKDGFIPVLWDSPELAEAPALPNLFCDSPQTGFQTARDKKRYSPIAPERDAVFATVPAKRRGDSPVLIGNLGEWARLPLTERRAEWKTSASTRSKKTVPTVESLSTDKITRVLYRPLDYRWLYNDRDWVDWYRDDLQRVYQRLGDVPTLITNPRGQGRGPAVSHSLVLPDQHAFNNRGGRAIWCLWQSADVPAVCGGDLDPRLVVGTRRTGLSSGVADWLESLGRPQAFDDAYSYILAMLSGSEYTQRNWLALVADDLRVPLTEDQGVFTRAVEIGQELRRAWELRATSGNTQWTGNASGAFGKAEWRNGAIHFAEGRVLHGVSEEAWSLTISRYRVLPNWFKARESWGMSIARASEAQAVCAAAEQLVRLSEQANDLLAQYPPVNDRDAWTNL